MLYILSQLQIFPNGNGAKTKLPMSVIQWFIDSGRQINLYNLALLTFLEVQVMIIVRAISGAAQSKARKFAYILKREYGFLPSGPFGHST